MPIIQIQPYREQVKVLRQYEPWRSLWRVAVGAFLCLLVPGLAVGGFIAGAYLAGDLHRPPRVVGGALIAVGCSWSSAYIWSHRLWRVLVDRRLRWWARIPPGGGNAASVLLTDADWPRALPMIRRAGVFAPTGARRVKPPDDAPELCFHLVVARPEALLKDGGAAELTRATLAKAQIRARVEDVDVP